MKVCVIFNPVARGEKAERFRDQLVSLSGSVTLKPTYAPGCGRTLAAEAVLQGFDTIVAAGGDGTINEVLNGLNDVPPGLVNVRFGVIPLGTVNVFAREMALPMECGEAWETIRQGKENRIDLPEVEFVADGQPQHRCFAQLAGAGLDSRAIALVDWKQKKAMGPVAYVVAGFKALAERKSLIRVTAPNVDEMGELVLIGNGRFYGGSFRLFPKADPRDGLLDVTIFPRVNWEVLLRSGWGWLTDQIHHAAGCITFQAANFTLSSDAQTWFELDGENVGQLPATFGVRPMALRVLVP